MGNLFFVLRVLSSSAAEQVISKNKTEDNNGNCKKPVCNKKHDSHANGYPEENKPYHPFHDVLLPFRQILCIKYFQIT